MTNCVTQKSKDGRDHNFPWLSYLLSIILVFTLVAVGHTQEDRKPKNLKILPKTIPHDSLIHIMSNFSNALGVGCDFCHQRSETSREMDFASDAKSTKLTARDMLKMVAKINDSYLANLPTKSDAPRVTVECVTCHRGQAMPWQLQDVLKAALAKGGMHALDSTYRFLRTNYYGDGSFDFSDNTLAFLALGVAANSTANAMDILKLNAEFNPNSATNEWATGRIYLSQNDTTAAIAAYQRALKINPEFRRASRELQMLQGGGGQPH